jgi:TRAP-type C4-dicarboxylate transport system substrate-binding protein
MRKGLIVLTLSLLISIITGTQAITETTERWKLGHLRAQGSAIDNDLQMFVTQIKEKTKGKFSFDVYAGGRLGDYSLVQERVSFGEVELFVGPFGTSIDKRLMLPTTPYLVNNWEQAKQLYHQGSPLFKTMARFLLEQNIKLIGGWPVYFGGIGLVEKPDQPGNPGIEKEMIIRTPPIKSFVLATKQLGYTPYPITWTYAKMGLKTGMVAGIIGGGAEGYAGLGDLINYYIPVKDHFEYWFFYMNLDAWNGLSDMEREHFLTTAKEMEDRRYQVAEEMEDKSLAELKQKGITIVDLTEKELGAMREKVQKSVWPQLEKDIGPEFTKIISIVTGTSQTK